MSHCPSCGRYTGPHQACPYCGARLSGRVPLQAIKIAAILLATVGFAALWFAATRVKVPLVSIGQAGATMNMAYVRLQGHCTRAASYDPESEYLSFWIEDDTGEICVSAYRAETQQIIEEERVPALGDLVEVAGTLRVREDFLSLTLNVPEQLKITRAEPVDRAIGTIGPDDRYLRVRVHGQVRSIYEPYQGLTLITIRDGTGSIPVAVSEDLLALSGTSPTLSKGQAVEVVAAVSLYRDTPQLAPASAGDIVPLGETVPIAVERRIGQLSASDVGQMAVVRGTVTGFDPFSAGVKLAVDDTTGTMTVLLWQSIYEGLRNAPESGAKIRVQGEISEYQGQLELIPELAEDVQVLAFADSTPNPKSPSNTKGSEAAPSSLTGRSASTETPRPTETPVPTIARTPTPAPTGRPAPGTKPTTTPTPTVEPRAIAAITADRMGEEVTVEGTVIDTASFSTGLKFTLDDGTGRIVLLMWHDVYDDCWDAPEINLGAKVLATGEVSQYEGELQIQPGFGGDVKAVEGAPPLVPQREIGSISSEEEGQRVTIEGEVVRVEGLRSAAKVFVGDETGEILVFIWGNVLDRVANNTGLGTPGSCVRIAGIVEVYRGNLEVVPTLPNDMVVLDIP